MSSYVSDTHCSCHFNFTIFCIAKISCNKVTRYVNSKLLYHGQFNNSISDWWPRQNLDKSNSLYDLDIFSLNCNLDA